MYRPVRVALRKKVGEQLVSSTGIAFIEDKVGEPEAGYCQEFVDLRLSGSFLESFEPGKDPLKRGVVTAPQEGHGVYCQSRAGRGRFEPVTDVEQVDQTLMFSVVPSAAFNECVIGVRVCLPGKTQERRGCRAFHTTGGKSIEDVQLTQDVGPHPIEQLFERYAVEVIEHTWQQPGERATTFQQQAVVIGRHAAERGHQGSQIPDPLRRSGFGQAFRRLAVHARQQPTQGLVASGTDAVPVKPVDRRDQRKERTAGGIDVLGVICDVHDIGGRQRSPLPARRHL